MSTLASSDTAVPPEAPDACDLSRLLKFDLQGQEVLIVRSPFDFTKKTQGAAAAVDYLLDERGIVSSIEATRATVREKLISLRVPLGGEATDRNIRHKEAVIDIARQGANIIEDGINRGSKVLIVRGAHDAMDLSGVLRATGGNVGVVIVDTHADIHTPSTSTSKNPHGMWVSALLGDGEGLQDVMDDTPILRPENIIYIGLSQLEEAEVQRLAEKKITVFTGYDLNPERIKMALDALQARVPIWLDIDEDAMVNAAATMPGGMVSPETLKIVANRIGTNQKLEGMHAVLGVGLSEFQSPSSTDALEVANAQYQAEVLKAAVHQALGAGYHEDSTDEGPQASVRSSMKHISRCTIAALTLLGVTIGSFFIGDREHDSRSQQKSRSLAVSRHDDSFVKDHSYSVAGMPSASPFLPIITPDWKTNATESFTREFGLSAIRYSEALSIHDDPRIKIAEKEMMTFLFTALLMAGDNATEKEKIFRYARECVTSDQWTSLSRQMATVSRNEHECNELKGWMKLWQLI